VHELVDHIVNATTTVRARRKYRRFAILEKELDHDDGELTATQKVARHDREEIARELASSTRRGLMQYLIQLLISGLAIGPSMPDRDGLCGDL